MKHATMPDVVVKLMEGRARIANGWCQGRVSVFRPDSLGGPLYCALGAIGNDRAAFRQLVLVLPRGATVSAYNDAPGRTQSDILALFDRAISLALQ